MERIHVETVELDENDWRAWVHKGKLREDARKRKRRLIAGIALALVVLAAVIRRLLLVN